MAVDYYYDSATGEYAANFFPLVLRHVKGEWAGQPLKLEPWQSDGFIKPLFGWKRTQHDGIHRPEIDVRRYRTAYLEIGRKNSKALALDTPIPTPHGWKTIGELNEGDEIYHPSGKVYNVVAVSKIFHDECYSVEFKNAKPIIASKDHIWRVWDRNKLRGYRLVDTASLFRTYIKGRRGDTRYSVEVSKPLNGIERRLLIDPYVLGLWLGDGTTHCAHITAGSRDVEELVCIIETANICAAIKQYRPGTFRIVLQNKAELSYCRRGHLKQEYRTKKRKFNRCILCERLTERAKRHNRSLPNLDINCLTIQEQLRELGVLGNKHIPYDYLWGSRHQRLALLQGLMDSDGSCSLAGQCSFTSINYVLAKGVHHLALSLGLKPSILQKISILNGRSVGNHWHVTFYAFRDMPVFRLRRKVERLRERPAMGIKKSGRALRQTFVRSQTRSLERVERVPIVPTRCIQVNSPDGMFLAGESLIPTHNSTLAAGLGLYLLICDGEPGCEVYGAAADREQARIVFSIAKGMIEQDADLSMRCKCYKNLIEVPRTGAIYRVLSSDVGSKHGFNAHGVIFDEVHAQPNAELWDVLTTSGGARRQPLTVALTTAGVDRHSLCYKLHEQALRILQGKSENMSFLPVVYAADEDDDWTNEETWKKANPNLGVSVSLDFLREECKLAQEMPSRENTFRRLYLNQWVQQETRWVSLDKWDKCKGDLNFEELKGRECYIGIDLSTTTDISAAVLCFPFPNEEVKLLPFFWVPQANIAERVRRDKVPYDEWVKHGMMFATPGNVVDYSAIRQHLNAISKVYNIREIVIDRWNATTLVTWLEEDGFEVIMMGQGFASLSAPTKVLEGLILSSKLHHGDNEVLRWMMGNVAIESDAAGNVKPSKKGSQERIDGIVAAINGLSRLALRKEEKKSVYFERGLRSF